MLDVLLPPPPRDSGWESDDLDMYDLPDHVELIYGALELMMSPQRTWHHLIIRRLANALESVAEPQWQIEQEMTVRINRKNRPEPDLLLVKPSMEYTPATKWFYPEDVGLAVEVESPESETRDQELKPAIYALGRIPYYLRVSEGEGFVPIMHLYKLVDGKYQLVSEHEGRLVMDEPVKIDVEIKAR